MASVSEVDSISVHDEREAMLSSRLASLNIPDSPFAATPASRRQLHGRDAAVSPEPYALSSTLAAAMQVAESQRLQDNLRAREHELERSRAAASSTNPSALTERNVHLSDRLREREELAESLRERERVLEQKLKEKRSTEAALMRRVEQLQSRLLDAEATGAQSSEEVSGLQQRLGREEEAKEQAEQALKDARKQPRRLEFQTKQQDEQVKALANRVKQESIDKASRWKEYSVVEKGMQQRLRDKEAEEFRLLEKVRGLETRLEMQQVKLSEMVAREQALLAQVDEYRAAEQQMADGVRETEVRSKALADSLVAKEASEGELLEQLRQMEMRNGTLNVLLQRSEKMHSTLKDSEARLKAELAEREESEARALQQASLFDTERRVRGRRVDDLTAQVQQLERMVADDEEIAASLRAGKEAVEGERPRCHCRFCAAPSSPSKLCVSHGTLAARARLLLATLVYWGKQGTSHRRAGYHNCTSPQTLLSRPCPPRLWCPCTASGPPHLVTNLRTAVTPPPLT
mgnify:CR=1 FL=1